MLRVIDLSDAQAGLDLSTIADQFDAVKIKATGGTGYVNPDCDGWVQQAIALGKKWGVYHYFSDGFNDSDPVAEADWFVNNCLGYIGKGILALDWERGGNPDVNNTAMADQCLQRIEARTAVKPLIYMSLSLVTELDWSAVIANDNGLWCADYVDDAKPIANFNMDPNRDPNPQWDGTVNDIMWQFTSTGRLTGYPGNLDCSFFYGGGETWDAYAKVQGDTSVPAPIPPPEVTPPADPTPAPPEPETPPAEPSVPTEPPVAPTEPTPPVDTGTSNPRPIFSPKLSLITSLLARLKALLAVLKKYIIG